MYSTTYERQKSLYKNKNFQTSDGPLEGQFKFPDEDLKNFKPQGFFSNIATVLSSLPTYSNELDFAANVLRLANAVRETIKSWYTMVYNWVVKTYHAIKDTLARWSIVIKLAFDSILASLKDKSVSIVSLFSVFQSAGVPVVPEVASVTNDLAEAAHNESKTDDFVPQSGCEDFVKNVVSELPLPLMTAVVTSLLWIGNDQFGVSDVAGKFYKTITGFSAIQRLDPGELSKKMVNFIYHAFTGKDFWIEYELAREFNMLTHALTDDLAKLDTMLNPTMDLQRRITANYIKLEHIYPSVVLNDQKNSAANNRIYTFLRDKANPWVCNAKGATRIKPVTIVMSGPSAVGKTWTQNNLIQDIPLMLYKLLSLNKTRKDLPIYEAHARMPTKHIVNCMGEKPKFNDGYMSPMFYCFEEYQTSTLETVKTEWSNHFMKCINSESYMMDMAFEKGKVYFCSPFVIATGNFDTHHKQVHDVTAYHRRIEFDFKVSRSTIPIGKTFDPSKHCKFTATPEMDAMLRSEKTPSEALTSMYVKLTARTGSNDFTYPQVVMMACAVYFERITAYHLAMKPRGSDFVDVMVDSFRKTPGMTEEALRADGAAVFWLSQQAASSQGRQTRLTKMLTSCKDTITSMRESLHNTRRDFMLKHFKFDDVTNEKPVVTVEEDFEEDSDIISMSMFDTFEDVTKAFATVIQACEADVVDKSPDPAIIYEHWISQLRQLYDNVLCKEFDDPEEPYRMFRIFVNDFCNIHEVDCSELRYFEDQPPETPVTMNMIIAKVVYCATSRTYKDSIMPLVDSYQMVNTNEECAKIYSNIRAATDSLGDYANMTIPIQLLEEDVIYYRRNVLQTDSGEERGRSPPKDNGVKGKQRDKTEVKLSGFTPQSGNETPWYYKVPSEGFTPKQNSRRADIIFNLGRELMSLTSPNKEAGDGSCMGVTKGNLLRLLNYNYVKDNVLELAWDMAIDYDPSNNGCNPWKHFSLFDTAAMKMRHEFDLWHVTNRLELNSSRWTNYKRMFGRMYFHWHMCYNVIINTPRIHLTDHQILADKEFTSALSLMTPKQFSDVIHIVKRDFNLHITRRGVVCELSLLEIHRYQVRQAINKGRNKSEPKPREIYVKMSDIDRAIGKKNKKAEKKLKNARASKYDSFEEQFGDDSDRLLVHKRFKDKFMMASNVGNKSLQTRYNAVILYNKCSIWDCLTRSNFSKKVALLKEDNHAFYGEESIVINENRQPTKIELIFLWMLFCLEKRSIGNEDVSPECRELYGMIVICALHMHVLESSHQRHLEVETFYDIILESIPSWYCSASYYKYHIVAAAMYVRDGTSAPPPTNEIIKVMCVDSRNEVFIPTAEYLLGVQYTIRAMECLFNVEYGNGLAQYYAYTDRIMTPLKLFGIGAASFVVSFSLSYLIGMLVMHLVKYGTQSRLQSQAQCYEDKIKLKEKETAAGIKSQSGASGSFDLKNKDDPKAVNVEQRLMKDPDFVAHMGSNTTCIAKTIKNQYAILANGFLAGDCIFVSASIGVMNSHVFNALPENFSLVPYSPISTVSLYKVQKSTVVVLDDFIDGDKVWFSIPKMRQHADIIKHFIKASEAENLVSLMSGCVSTFKSQDCTTSLDVVENLRHVNSKFTIKSKVRSYDLLDTILYTWPGAVRGACGSVLYGSIDSMCKMLGIHTAGKADTKTGVATIITWEEAFRYSVRNTTETRCPLIDTLPAFCRMPFSMSGTAYKYDEKAFEDIEEQSNGCFVTPVITQATGSSVFIPTDFQNLSFEGGSPKIPATLDYESYQLSRKKEKLIDPVNYNPIVDSYIDQYKELIYDKLFGGVVVPPCRTLTLSEALGSFQNLKPFDKSTSKGIRLKYLGLSKKAILEGGNHDRDAYEKVHERRFDRMVSQKKYEYQINFDKLKDELRDPERVANKKTRTFKITDFDDNVIMKRCVGHLVSATKELHWCTPPSCGVDPGGSEWRLIARYFSNSPTLFTDVSGFESTVSSLCYGFFWFLFSKTYPDPVMRDLACYAVCMTINAIRFNRGKGFVLGRQNTSGNWLTTWINTIVNMLYFSVIVIHGSVINGEDPGENLRNLKIKLYSDDNITSLDKPWYNVLFIQDTFKELLHVSITSVDKSDDISMSTIWKGSFLSRSFREDRGQVFCPLAYESLIAQLYYVRVPKKRMGDSAFVYTQLQQNLDNVSRELKEYPTHEADLLARKILKFVLKYKLPVTFNYDFSCDPVRFKLLLQ